MCTPSRQGDVQSAIELFFFLSFSVAFQISFEALCLRKEIFNRKLLKISFYISFLLFLSFLYFLLAAF